MKKLVLLYLLISFCVTNAWSRQISENDAQSIARTFTLSNNTHRRAPGSPAPVFTTAHIACDNNGNNLLYVFNRSDEGYIIVAADDKVGNPVLGYSDEGAFDNDAMPPSMRSWLAMYEQEIEQARRMSQDETVDTYQSQFNKNVAPLVEARWGQDAPYNALCPSLNNLQSPTGCVATAMAQIMYHHKWPAQGSGKKELYDSHRTEIIDFANTTYQWDVMTPVYSSLSTEAECNAVATLMYHAGRSVNMMYGEVSGAVSAEAANALATYWKYDKAIIHRDRQYYTIEEWERMIMEEIDNNRPILYHGQSPEGGHAFVLDGYNENGYVHINWGWNGMSNGYFLLQALSPEKQGTGGFKGGYNTGQGAIFGIQPNQGNQSTIEITAQSFTIPNTMTYRTGELISTVVKGLANAGWNPATFNIGYMLYDDNDNLVATINSSSLSIGASSSVGTRNIMLTLPDTLANGTYRIYLAHTDANDQWKHVAMSMNTLPYNTLQVEDDKVTVLTKEEGSLWATDIACNDEALYANRYTSFAVTMRNTTATEFYGSIFISIFEKTGKFEQRRSAPIAVSIPAGEDVSLDIPMRIEVNKGTYCLFITNEQKDKLSDALKISVLEEPASPELKVSDFVLHSTAQDCLQVSYSITNKGNDYTGVFRPWIQFSNLQSTSSYINTDTVTIKQGETMDFNQTWSFDDGVVGESYICTLWCQDLRRGGMSQLSQENITFTLTEPTAVDATMYAPITLYPNPATHYIHIGGNEVIESTSIYNMQGTLVTKTTDTTIYVGALPQGVYYVVTTTNKGIETNKLLIK